MPRLVVALPVTAGARGGGGDSSEVPLLRHVTSSVLPHKQLAKTCHEHHIYLILHVIYCVDKVL
jgi:hypothetical protein